jgi:hypothetical protein
MQGYLLDGVRMEAHQPVELRAVGEGGERISQMALGVAVEISLAGESRPAGEDGERDDFALAIRALAVKRGRIAHLNIEELEVGRLHVRELVVEQERRPVVEQGQTPPPPQEEGV